MRHQTPDTATNPKHDTQSVQFADNQQNLLAEMQALFSMMPGALLAHEGPLPTDEEVEAMFDNMPV